MSSWKRITTGFGAPCYEARRQSRRLSSFARPKDTCNHVTGIALSSAPPLSSCFPSQTQFRSQQPLSPLLDSSRYLLQLSTSLWTLFADSLSARLVTISESAFLLAVVQWRVALAFLGATLPSASLSHSPAHPYSLPHLHDSNHLFPTPGAMRS
jgi:hypothetical protein